VRRPALVCATGTPPPAPAAGAAGGFAAADALPETSTRGLPSWGQNRAGSA
jgi:hypothetical protein